MSFAIMLRKVGSLSEFFENELTAGSKIPYQD